METQETICRLCLKTCESFTTMDGNMKESLEKLLPKIDLDAIKEPLICTGCADMLVKCFDFKTACLNAYDYTVSFVNNKDSVKLDLKDVYLCKNEKSTGVPDDQDICGFCIRSVKNCFAVSDIVEKEDSSLRKMIEQCLPELDLGIIENSIICAPCRGSLEKCFRFVTNCLIVEEKIKKCRETVDLNSQIKLSSLLQFTIRSPRNEVEKQLTIKREYADEEEFGNGRDIIKFEQVFCNNSENIKDEVEHKDSFDDLEFNNEEQFIPKNMLVKREDINNLDPQAIKMGDTLYGENKVKEEYVDEVEDQKYLMNEETNLKPDFHFNRLEDGMVLSQPEDTISLDREEKYLMQNLQEDPSVPHIKQTLANKKDSVLRMYQCELCSFQSKYKSSLKIHLLNHMDPSEITIYKCDYCLYQTKHKYNLNSHLLKHKDPSEVIMYKCDSCSFQTRHNRCLKNHLLVHKNPSEVTMHKCNLCSYQTKLKYSLKVHIQIHSQTKTYKCDLCSFLTKGKHCLRRHMHRHKNSSDITIYKCDTCSYQTKYKEGLKSHLLVHKNFPEVTMYKCYKCSYQTKYKCDLRKHILRHPSVNKNVQMFLSDRA